MDTIHLFFMSSLILLLTPPFTVVSIESGPQLNAFAETVHTVTNSPAVGIVRTAGGETQVGVAGVRIYRNPIDVTPDDLWHIGANTKSMTATLVARLAEQGVMSWDDTVAHHLGSALSDIPPRHAQVTFRHLLSRRAGMPSNVSLRELLRFIAANDDKLTATE